jgi:hypothetical protein
MQVKGLKCTTFDAYQNPLKTPSSRRPGWEAFVYRYTSECMVWPLHKLSECECFVTSFVFWIMDVLGLAAPEWFFF